MRRDLWKAARVAAAMAVVAVLVLLASSGGGAAAPTPATGKSATGTGLDALPFPGTPDAPPRTEIIFPAIQPAQIAAVSVEGSRSGSHAGHMSAQPAGNGTAFSPARPFTPGEQVSVTATLRSTAAAAASGAPGARRLAFSFSIARPASFPTSGTVSPPDVSDTQASPARPVTHTFITAPRLHPPTIGTQGKIPDRARGNIFVDAENTGHPGSIILNTLGQLLYFGPSAGNPGHGPSLFNVRVQRDQGRPVMTFWQGRIVPPGVGRGKDLILNNHYQTIHTVTAGDGFQSIGTDLHEFTLGHEGHETTAFVTIVAPERANLTAVGGPANGEVLDWIMQEIDVATNKVIWEWNAYHHIPLTSSYEPYVPGRPYDFFHLNSIQQLPDGHIIISARHTFAVYSIEKKTGGILWELGGKHSSFVMGPNSRFEWQHDATLHNGLLTVFDDSSVSAYGQSRGLELHVDIPGRRASMIRSFTHKPNPVLATSQGSVERLPDHNVFVGFGSGRYFVEYGPGGGQLWEGSFPVHVGSYRAYRFSDWVGQPLWRPSVVMRKAKTPGHDFIFVSWNGATRVTKWRILASSSKTGKFSQARPGARWASFQTRIYVALSAGRWFKVEALNSKGQPLPHGTSAPVLAP